MTPRTRWLLGGVLAAGVAAIGGGLTLSAAGLIPIAASDGHWRWAAWFLHFTMQRSVATYSADIEPPPLTDPELIRLGAVHYGNACAPCHGGIDSQPLMPQKMTPPAPKLPGLIGQWKPTELHWIIEHGIRYSAMPAWPTDQRDDDIWPVVAFLQAMPGMTEARYRTLAYDADLAPRLQDLRADDTASCWQCHGEGDQSPLAAVPALGCLSSAYLAGSLRAYARGDRHSGIMQPIAAQLTSARIAALATLHGGKYSSCKYREGSNDARDATREATSPTAIARGARIASEGIPARGVPPCVSCHGRSGRPEFPTLDGQSHAYLRIQLGLFRTGKRGGTVYAPLMATVADRLEEDDIDDLAAYYATRNAEPD